MDRESFFKEMYTLTEEYNKWFNTETEDEWDKECILFVEFVRSCEHLKKVMEETCKDKRL